MEVLKSIFKNRYLLSEERLSVCKTCDRFNKISSQCSICGCFMNYKTLLYDASCPVDKWLPYEEDEKKEDN